MSGGAIADIESVIRSANRALEAAEDMAGLNPPPGQAVVGVYERNGVTCEVPDGQVCCGMPWLDAGDTEKFEQHARRNVEALVGAVRAGHDIVVPQPTCAYVLKYEVPDFLGSEDADLVAAHTYDTSEYLMQQHRERPREQPRARVEVRLEEHADARN